MRNHRRTLLTILSIASGLATLLWLTCLFEGHNRKLVQAVTQTYIGNFQLMRADYRSDRWLDATFSADIKKIQQSLGTAANATERVVLPSLLAVGTQSVPIHLVGVDPDLEPKVTNLSTRMTQGTFVTGASKNCDVKELVIGRKLQESLNIQIGNKAVLLSQSSDGSLASELFRVSGVFDTRSDVFDKGMAFTSIACVNQMASLEGMHQIVLKSQPERESEVRSIMSQIIPGIPAKKSLELVDWRTEAPGFASMIRFNQASLLMIAVIVFSIIIIGVVNTLLMSVFERTREFGMMAALGATPRKIRSLILCEALILSVLSTVLGIAAGSLVVFYQSKAGLDLTAFLADGGKSDLFAIDLVAYPVFHWVPFFKACLIIIACILAASLYPAYRASILHPLEALRNTT